MHYKQNTRTNNNNGTNILPRKILIVHTATSIITCQNHRVSVRPFPDQAEGSVAWYLCGRFQDNECRRDYGTTGTCTSVITIHTMTQTTELKTTNICYGESRGHKPWDRELRCKSWKSATKSIMWIALSNATVLLPSEKHTPINYLLFTLVIWSLPVLILFTHGGMARLCWPGWLGPVRRRYTRERSPISVLTQPNVE